MSDESAASLTLHFNRQNQRQYIRVEDVRPRDYVTTQDKEKEKVRNILKCSFCSYQLKISLLSQIHFWCALMSDGTIIGPIFYEPSMTGQKYFE